MLFITTPRDCYATEIEIDDIVLGYFCMVYDPNLSGTIAGIDSLYKCTGKRTTRKKVLSQLTMLLERV